MTEIISFKGQNDDDTARILKNKTKTIYSWDHEVRLC